MQEKTDLNMKSNKNKLTKRCKVFDLRKRLYHSQNVHLPCSTFSSNSCHISCFALTAIHEYFPESDVLTLNRVIKWHSLFWLISTSYFSVSSIKFQEEPRNQTTSSHNWLKGLINIWWILLDILLILRETTLVVCKNGKMCIKSCNKLLGYR